MRRITDTLCSLLLNPAQPTTVLSMPRQNPATATSGVAIAREEMRSRRKLAGLILQDLAARTGLSVGYLSQIERGARPTVSPRAFGIICDSLGIPAGRRHVLEAKKTRAAA